MRKHVQLTMSLLLLSAIIITLLTGCASAESVAEKCAKAYQESDYKTAYQYLPIDNIDEYVTRGYSSVDVFLDEMGTTNYETFHTMNDYYNYMKEYRKDKYHEKYGEYTITVRAAQEKEIRLNDIDDSDIERFKKYGLNKEDITEAKKVTIKTTIKGTFDSMYDDIVILTCIKVKGSWKVLD